MNNYFDLEKELRSVIEEFGEHEGYIVPSIKWSEGAFWAILGEYRYWKNEIIISRSLDSPATKPDFLRYIIFHEYTHQLYAEHDNNFAQEMSRFPNHEVMVEFLDKAGDPLYGAPTLPPIDRKAPVLFCRLPYRKEDPDSFWSGVLYTNHYNAGSLYGKIPEKYCREKAAQVIWVVEEDGGLYLAGAARNVRLFPNTRVVHDKELFGARGKNARIQFSCKQSDTVFTFPQSRMLILFEKEIPDSFYSDNAFTGDDISDDIYQQVLDCYEKFDQDVQRKGMDDCEMDTLAPVFETDDVDELYEKACKETNSYRKIWILNRCLAMRQNYRLYRDLAAAFDDAAVFDRAIENYQKALEYRNQASVRARIEKIRSVIPEYEKYGLW